MIRLSVAKPVARLAVSASLAALACTSNATWAGNPDSGRSVEVHGLGTGRKVCENLLRALLEENEESLERIWTRLQAFDIERRKTAVTRALELGRELKAEGVSLNSECLLAPMERDRFGWISRQNKMLVKLRDGSSKEIRFDLVEEAGSLLLTGELRSEKAGASKGRFIQERTSLLERSVSFLGIPFLLAVAWALSVDRKKVQWRTVLWGVGLQIVLALIVLSPGIAEFFFNSIDSGVKTLLSFSEKGAEFVFQSTAPHLVFAWDPATNRILEGAGYAGTMSSAVKTFTFWILPTIIFFSSLMTVLYHLGIMQKVVKLFAWAMQKTMRTSGSETLSAAANIFVGQTEAPLVVKPFVADMTMSELHAVMVGGFATVAGGVMAAYVGFLRDIPGIAGHLVTASIMSAPAALVVAKIMYPETEKSRTAAGLEISIDRPDRNVIEAAARGATEGMTLLLNVVAMLVAFVGLVAMLNYFLGMVGTSMEEILGYLFWPFAFFMGVPASEAHTVGSLLGEKLVLTEFIAYLHLGDLVSHGGVLSQRSAIIASYALCGFANFASVGIQLGGIGGIAPNRRSDLAKICLRAMFGGFLAANMTATIAGIIL